MLGKQNTYEIMQDLVNLIKGETLENYSGSVLDDYRNLLNDAEGFRKAKRIRHLSGSPKKTEQGISFLPEVVVKWGFQDKLHSMTPPKTLIWEMHSMTPPQNSSKKFHKLYSMTPPLETL